MWYCLLSHKRDTYINSHLAGHQVAAERAQELENEKQGYEKSASVHAMAATHKHTATVAAAQHLNKTKPVKISSVVGAEAMETPRATEELLTIGCYRKESHFFGHG